MIGTYVINAVYNGTASFGSSTDSTHTLTIASTGELQFGSATYNSNENDPTAIIILTRTGGSFGAASVTFATGGGTAPADVDYIATTSTVTWADGDTSPKIVSVPLINHNAADTRRLADLSQAAASLGDPAAATLTIRKPKPML